MRRPLSPLREPAALVGRIPSAEEEGTQSGAVGRSPARMGRPLAPLRELATQEDRGTMGKQSGVAGAAGPGEDHRGTLGTQSGAVGRSPARKRARGSAAAAAPAAEEVGPIKYPPYCRVN